MHRHLLRVIATLVCGFAPVQAADDPPAPVTTASAATSVTYPAAVQAHIDAAKSWFGTYTAPGTKVRNDQGQEVVAPASTINNGDNAWMMVSTLLVLLMTIPGLAFFYGGLVRRKNVLSTMMHSFILAGVVSVIWAVFGFSIAFGGSGAGWGGFEFVLLHHVVFDPTLVGHANRFPINLDYAPTISFAVFCMFQLMFAIITPALISGAFAERIKFSGMLVFTVIWLLFCYLPLAHMVWGRNGLFNWGFGATTWAAFDFAGGTVVHLSSGVAALVVAIVLGRRRGYPHTAMPPHNLVFSILGACLLWVGWFGFNAGSALGANGLAGLAFVNTHLATAAAALAWPLVEWLIRGKPTVLGAISGAVAGLVAITPACGFVTPGSALLIGFLAGGICFLSTSYLKRAAGYDDALDAFGVHGVGGLWGAIATGIFFHVEVNPNLAALNPDLYAAIVAGTHPVLWNQLKACLVTILLSGVVALVAALIARFTVGLRASDEHELAGLDLSMHGEEAYNAA